MLGKPLPDRFQPGDSIGVVQGMTGGHLGQVRRRVEVISIAEWNAKPLRERRTHR